MNKRSGTIKIGTSLSAIGALICSPACSGDDARVIGPAPQSSPPSESPLNGGTGGNGSTGGADVGSAEPAPLYVIANEIYAADGSTSYVNVLPSLDIATLDHANGIEYSGGRATIQAFGGSLYVAGPESPVITRFAISDDGGLTETGAVSFANYGFEALVIDDWSVSFISPEKAYLLSSVDGTSVIWNPTTMEITGEVDQAGFDLVRPPPLILNYSPAVAQGNRLLRTIFWDDWDAGKYGLEQHLAIYDTDTDRLVELVPESRCPALGNRVNRDEAGNLYFSNWIWNVAETLLSQGPKSCALRIDAGAERFREDWVLPYAGMTDGREAAIFSYLENGKGLLSVFHDERATIDEMTVPDELMSTDNWRVWSMDLEARTGAPLEGLDWMAGAASTFRIGSRSFIFVPAEDWSVTHVYEIVDGRASFAFDVNGWSFQLLQVR